MFRGFIGEIGELTDASPGGVTVAAPKACAALVPGGSVAVAGTCLSAEVVEAGSFRASLSEETRRRTTLGGLPAGTRVNVELPLRAGDAIEGHLVQGHVDAVGKVVRVEQHPGGPRVWIRPPERLLEALVAKGSVAVDGVSLTVADVVRDRFSVALVPATLERTTLGELREGDRVNLESDLVERLARRFEGRAHEALRRVVAAMPWSGMQSGRLGVEKVVAQIAAGGCALVFDPTREGEGDVVCAGVELRPATFAFILTQCCSHPTVPCDRARLDRLEIPPMPGAGDHQGTAMHVSVDLAAARGTGVSAAERSATVRRLACAEARPEDFVRPGHVFPLGARPGGLRERAGHTESAVELCRAAKLPTVAVICEVMSPDGHMAGAAELERFALHWGLPLVEIGELGSWL
jgi:3,4-dihydroxy 2-butanone 4-phosphate synthase/3,4-dihydroxy 2-butanone 4-phosphate synthase/GTP cyclohydrolase II